MKIIDLTKDSFVEKVADYQSYPCLLYTSDAADE